MISYSVWRAKLPHVVTPLPKSRYGDADWCTLLHIYPAHSLALSLNRTADMFLKWEIRKLEQSRLTDYLIKPYKPLTLDMSGP